MQYDTAMSDDKPLLYETLRERVGSISLTTKDATANKFADIWLPDGMVKSLTIQGAAVLQGFPDWYEFPNDTATAGSIIGYSVPPCFAAQLFTDIQRQLAGV